MPIKEKTQRNKQIVQLRKFRPNHYSTRVLSNIFNIRHSWVAEILKRDYDKYDIPPEILKELHESVEDKILNK